MIGLKLFECNTCLLVTSYCKDTRLVALLLVLVVFVSITFEFGCARKESAESPDYCGGIEVWTPPTKLDQNGVEIEAHEAGSPLTPGQLSHRALARVKLHELLIARGGGWTRHRVEGAWIDPAAPSKQPAIENGWLYWVAWKNCHEEAEDRKLKAEIESLLTTSDGDSSSTSGAGFGQEAALVIGRPYYNTIKLTNSTSLP